MFDWLPIAVPPAPLFFAQLLVGLINGAFYAMLSLGLSVIFGLLNIINFTHGAQYMMGAFAAYFVLQWAGLGYWWALLIAPIAVGILGIAIERFLLRRIARLDHLYGLLLTFGLALIIEGIFRQHMVVKGRNRDTAWYSMTDVEWPSRRVAFETWLSRENFTEEGVQRRSLAEIRSS